MYSKAKGKAGSKKPIVKTNPVWQRYKAKELELITIKLAKAGKTSAEIGLYLRDVYGVPDFATVMGKSITGFLVDKKLGKDLPEDLLALIKKSVTLQKHMEGHKKDMPGKRGTQLTVSKINRLIKYYKNTGKIAPDFNLDRKNLRLYVG